MVWGLLFGFACTARVYGEVDRGLPEVGSERRRVRSAAAGFGVASALLFMGWIVAPQGGPAPVWPMLREPPRFGCRSHSEAVSSWAFILGSGSAVEGAAACFDRPA
jgi:hypothetical protein